MKNSTVSNFRHHIKLRHFKWTRSRKDSKAEEQRDSYFIKNLTDKMN